MSQITDGPLLDDHKQHIVAVMTARTASGEPVLGEKARKQLQSAEFIYNYFTQSEWSSTFTSLVPLSNKLDAIAKRVVNLGIHNPSERSFASMVAVALHGSDVASQVSLQVLRDLKKLHRSLASRLVTPAVVPQSLPSDPLEFRSECTLTFDAVFAKEQPVQPPGGTETWAIASLVVPCRSTRAGCAQLPVARTSKSDMVVQSLMDLLGNNRGTMTKGTADIPIVMLNGQHDHHHGRPPLQILSEALPWQVSNRSPLLALPPIPTSCTSQPDAGDSQSSSGGAVGPISVQSVGHDALSANLSAAGGGDPQTSAGGAQESIEKMVQAMRAQMLPKRHPGTDARPMKRPAAAAAAAAAATPDAVRKRPAAATGYGCSRCRMKSHGCSQCWNPSFSGRRASG